MILKTWRKTMINKYKEKFMIWQLHYRTEIIIAVVAFVLGAVIF